jgi:NitT/TauT family transport system substrate-binding protein
MMKLSRKLAIASIALLAWCGAALAEPLKIGYSDWPGWVAWEVALEKGWFAEAGVDVKFEWFDYVASMDAFAAGQIDAVAMTNGDALVTGATGAKSVMILINDYSNGNDMVVARRGIDSVKALKGKKIGVEIGFVSHLLLLDALSQAGLSESDVELINVPTNETPQVLASGEVDAIVAWQPNSGMALSLVPGSTRIASSADQPGLIYDVLAVNPSSLAERRAEWVKVVQVWYRVVDYFFDPATRDDAIAIMASRVDVPPAEYAKFVDGTRILKLDEAKGFFEKKDGFGSLYGSSSISDRFNLDNDVYKEAQDIDSYIDPSITLGM